MAIWSRYRCCSIATFLPSFFCQCTCSGWLPRSSGTRSRNAFVRSAAKRPRSSHASLSRSRTRSTGGRWST
uniref:Putative secreted protein n=1 Tax=Anopheles triannulatus TaxID=58253 RepID=A0A2M4B5X6_9DIPT